MRTPSKRGRGIELFREKLASLSNNSSVYMTILTLRTLIFALLFPSATAVLALQNPTPGTVPEVFRLGIIIPKVAALAAPEQSYALFLPSQYTSKKRWPVVYLFDPGAQGTRPVELMKDAAERYGYILVASNNSKNGSWKIEAGAAQAMLQDTERRLALDPHRYYFAGFSGGARVASRIAQLCKCAAGVLLDGAGFQPDAATTESHFAVFASAGDFDFNYPEVVRMDEQLEQLGYAHFFRRFEGPHQWAPSSVMDESLTWFRIQEMKAGSESRDESLIASFAAKEEDRSRALEQSGDLYSAWREYRQAAELLAGLTDKDAFRARAELLEKDKAVKDGAKREKQEFSDQEGFSKEISSPLAALPQSQENHAEARRTVDELIIDLRRRTEHEKHEERLRVLKRALAGVFVQAMEAGLARLEQHDLGQAREYFELSCEADPDSVWALSNLAVAKAMDADRKGALETLRLARSKTRNPERFAEWLKEEPAFAKFGGTREFGSLMEIPAEH